jgi:hypothetical protein
MAIKTFTTGEVLTASDTNTYLANSGLTYITGGTQSGSTALNVDGVFTSTYTNYRLVLTEMETTVADRAIRFNFRASGATDSNPNYEYAYRGLRSNGAGGDTSFSSSTFAEIGVYLGTTANLKLGSATIDITSPNTASRSFGIAGAIGFELGTWQMRNGGFVFNADTTFDGFRLSMSASGNLSFKYQLYGYRKA